MPYKITIQKIEERKTVKRGEHTVIKQEPWTRETLDDEKYSFSSVEWFLERNPVRNVYGYAPAYEATEVVETKVLEQVVEELDFPAVISAINNL
jgi:hypothetical protein